VKAWRQGIDAGIASPVLMHLGNLKGHYDAESLDVRLDEARIKHANELGILGAT
jgi:hypothetical protein